MEDVKKRDTFWIYCCNWRKVSGENERLLSITMKKHVVSDVSLHPNNKYAVKFRLTAQEG